MTSEYSVSERKKEEKKRKKRKERERERAQIGEMNFADTQQRRERE
jgi:hypothetical protein